MSIRRFFRWYFFIPIALVGIPLLLAAVGEIVKLLWNALLPPLFGWPSISIWQGLGLLVLCRLLFGGHGAHGGRPSRRMTQEERARIRQRMCERFVGTSEPSQPRNVTDM